MTISVLMSVYKAEKASNLDRALNSIWTSQTLKPNQVVLVRDGPLNEELQNVINLWKVKIGDPLTLIDNDMNCGLTKSLNIGIRYVTSELIARMDSDDEAYQERFKLQHQFFIDHPEVDIIGGSMDMVDEKGNLKYVRNYPQDHDGICKMMPKVCPLGHPAVMMRASIFKEKELRYDERYRNGQDIALWFDAMAAGCRFGNVPDVVLRFSESPESYKRRGSVRAKNEFLAWMRGIYKNEGLFTYKYIFPFFRLIIRSLPSWLIKRYYASGVYQKIYAKR